MAAQVCNHVEKFEEADGVIRPAAKIEYVAADCIDFVEHTEPGGYGIRDMKSVAHLQAVSVDRYRRSADRLDHEMRDPALVLGAELARPVDATHAHHGRTQ